MKLIGCLSLDLRDVAQPRKSRRDQQWQSQRRRQPSGFRRFYRSGLRRRTQHLIAWDDYGMQKDVEMGWAGSLTVLILCITVAVLLRSFYKRYMRMNASKDEKPTDN